MTLDQDQWYWGDFSSENKLTGTVYTDINKTTAKDLTGYTLKVLMNRPARFADYFNKTADIVTAASGTWSYAVQDGEIPPPGIYYVKLELSKSGVKESTLNRAELQVLRGPQ